VLSPSGEEEEPRNYPGPGRVTLVISKKSCMGTNGRSLGWKGKSLQLSADSLSTQKKKNVEEERKKRRDPQREIASEGGKTVRGAH